MILEKVRKQIKKQNMISQQDRIVVGISGGADSVCLLLVLEKLRKEVGFSMEAVHIEHGIRGEESRQDAEFVKQLCEAKQIPFQMFSLDVPSYAACHGLGLEEAARILRYEVFEQFGKEKNVKIALAHHMEDNAETILFQMARGSVLSGLCGMRPIRQSETGVVYIRPLLCLHREEIERFLVECEQGYCEDSTNQELEYSRNYLRHRVIPELEEINTQAVSHINETAGYLSEIRDYLELQVQMQWQEIVTEDKGFVLDITKLEKLHVVLQRELVYKAIGLLAGGKKDISAVHVEQVLGLLKLQSGKEVSLPNGVRARKEHTFLRFFCVYEKTRKDEEAQCIHVSRELLEQIKDSKEFLELSVGNKGERIRIAVLENNFEVGEIPRKTYTKWLDYDKISDGFCIRTRQSGDYLICDTLGHRKKLKQYFVDEKIPIAKRDEIILLAQEHQVFWVIGGRMSEHIKVSEHTKTRIEITYEEETSHE